MDKSVYLLYEGDGWLSNGSLVLMGIFDSDEKLKNGAEELISNRINEHYDYAIECCCEDENDITKESVLNEILDELMDNFQYLGETSYIIKEAELNVVEEI